MTRKLREGIKSTGGFHFGTTQRSEDGAQVRETHWTIHSREISLTERIQIAEDQKKVTYTHHLRGPNATHQFEVEIDLT